MDPIVHTIDTPALWGWGVAVIALVVVGIGIRIQRLVSMIQHGLDKQVNLLNGISELKTMHDHADDFGFGTRATNEHLEKLIEALSDYAKENRHISNGLRDLIHYTTFDIKARTGHDPPPPPPNAKR